MKHLEINLDAKTTDLNSKIIRKTGLYWTGEENLKDDTTIKNNEKKSRFPRETRR